jgi:hypothetical protein
MSVDNSNINNAINAEKQLGSLTLDYNGSILQSSGELQGDVKTAKVIYNMLQDTNAILSKTSKDGFKRFTVSYPNFNILTTLIHDKIYVVKRAL